MQLYKLSFPNNKHYIGITSKTAVERLKFHCCSTKKYAVTLAIKKYGKENIVLTVLGDCDDWELLCLAEQEAIEKFNTKAPNGYNLTLGGEGTYGHVFTEQQKENNRLRMKLYHSNNPDARFEIGLKQKAFYLANPEARCKASEKTKQQLSTPEAREAHGKRLKAIFSTTEQRQANRDRQKAFFTSNPEHFKEQAKKLKKYFATPEGKKAHSEWTKAYFLKNPQAGKAHSERMKEIFSNPEKRKAMSDVKKAFHREHPESAINHSAKLKEFYANNPDRIKSISEKSKAQFADPIARVKMSLIKALHYAKKANRPFSYIPI